MSYVRYLTILSLLVAGCTASAPPEAEPKAAVAQDPSDSAFTVPAPEPPEPYASGFPLLADGGVIAPVPSVGLWIDKGDPPPDAIGQPSVHPPGVARPGSAGATGRR